MNYQKLQEIREYIISESEESKIYIACDSESYTKNNIKYADYYLVVVVHKNGHNGCKIFGDKITEKDYVVDKKRPTYRLMNEVYKASELYLKLSDVIGSRECEIHLDIASDKRYTSNIVMEQAIGYVKGTCNVIPLVKPNAWCATSVADKFLRVKQKKA